METALRSNQLLQIQSFWNLIQSSDESVQRGLLSLLNTKYSTDKREHHKGRSSFFSLKGALKSKGDATTDQLMIDDYLKEKYDV